jgi:hypothetical protein
MAFIFTCIQKYTDEAYNSTPCCGANIFKQNAYTPDNISDVSNGDFWEAICTTGTRAIRTLEK